jgi:hypothetical protein
MNVKIELQRTNVPIEVEARSTYQKGDLFCVVGIDGVVQKFPMATIFRVVENYTSATRP